MTTQPGQIPIQFFTINLGFHPYLPEKAFKTRYVPIRQLTHRPHRPQSCHVTQRSESNVFSFSKARILCQFLLKWLLPRQQRRFSCNCPLSSRRRVFVRIAFARLHSWRLVLHALPRIRFREGVKVSRLYSSRGECGSGSEVRTAQ